MRLVACLIPVAICVLLSAHSTAGWRLKRRLDEFGEMILLTCERNPLDFNGYGNYCGFGGSGKVVDEIDKCCAIHDSCYVHLNRAECSTLLKYRVYTTEYKWSYKKGNIICNEEDPCARELCGCDRAAATCFGKNEHVYNRNNKHKSLVSGLTKLLGMDFKS